MSRADGGRANWFGVEGEGCLLAAEAVGLGRDIIETKGFLVWGSLEEDLFVRLSFGVSEVCSLMGSGSSSELVDSTFPTGVGLVMMDL